MHANVDILKKSRVGLGPGSSFALKYLELLDETDVYRTDGNNASCYANGNSDDDRNSNDKSNINSNNNRNSNSNSDSNSKSNSNGSSTRTSRSNGDGGGGDSSISSSNIKRNFDNNIDKFSTNYNGGSDNIKIRQVRMHYNKNNLDGNPNIRDTLNTKSSSTRTSNNDNHNQEPTQWMFAWACKGHHQINERTQNVEGNLPPIPVDMSHPRLWESNPHSFSSCYSRSYYYYHYYYYHYYHYYD